MSIKRTAICPFCKSEMKKDPEEVKIPTKFRSVSVLISEKGNNYIIHDIEDTHCFRVHKCEKCGFVALWEGEL